jgi:transposase
MSDWKLMMKIAFHQNRILAYQILPKNTNVNFEVYLNFLSEVLHRGTNKHRIARLLILHEYTTPYKHRKVQEFFNRHRWEVLKHPPYSPDLNPCDYDGIARIKRPNKGKRFANEDELKAGYDKVIKEINLKNEATGIPHLPERWAVVSQTREEYIV